MSREGERELAQGVGDLLARPPRASEDATAARERAPGGDAVVRGAARGTGARTACVGFGTGEGQSRARGSGRRCWLRTRRRNAANE